MPGSTACCAARRKKRCAAGGASTHRPLTSGSTCFRAIASPYDLNPFNLNPLRDILKKFVDFDRVRASR